MKTVALIPLRGGGRRLPRKELKSFMGQPMCYWVLKECCECESIDEVWVSTHDAEIKEVVNSFGMPVQVLDRPAELASDTATTESVMLHFTEHVEYDLLVLAQATTPLIDKIDLYSGIEIISEYNVSSVFSCFEKKGRLLWTFNPAGTMVALNFDPRYRPPMNEVDPFFIESGDFWIVKRDRLLKKKCRIAGFTAPIPIETRTIECDIDTQDDFDRAEQYAKENGLCSTLYQCKTEKTHMSTD